MPLVNDLGLSLMLAFCFMEQFIDLLILKILSPLFFFFWLGSLECLCLFYYDAFGLLQETNIGSGFTLLV